MKHIEESLLNFLKDDTFKVATLKGEWGIGKTYFWRNYIAKHLKTLSFKAYSYVSLFGLSDIAAIKNQIFCNSESLGKKAVLHHLDKLKPLTKCLGKLNTAIP